MVTRLAWSTVKSPTCATSCRFHPKIRSWKGSTPSSRRNLITYEAPWASFSWTWSARRWRHLLSYLERCKHCQNLDKQKHWAQLPPKAKGFTKTLMFYDIFNTTYWRQPALKPVRSLTYDLEALQKKIYYLFIIFTHMIGAELSEIFGFYKL